MIPFFGPFVSWAPPVVVAAPDAEPDGACVPMLIIMVVGWFVIMNIVQPRVMANSVGIHPVVVLVSVLVGHQALRRDRRDLRGAGGRGHLRVLLPLPRALAADGGPRDVASRAAKRVEDREGRTVRVPAPPVVPGSPRRAS